MSRTTAPTATWRDRRKNDLLADWLLWSFLGQSLGIYRRSHMQHHVHLGDPLDTEIAYFDCLSPWFLVQTMVGSHLVVLVFRYIVRPKEPAVTTASPPATAEVPGSQRLTAVLRSALLHGSIIAVAAASSSWGAALAWLLGIVAMYPFFGTVRPILEHRRLAAPCDVDFSVQPHGPVNRWSGNDVFSRLFGAGGVNKHLLHHWDPTVSNTRFEDMEAFLRRSPSAATVEGAQTTSAATARAMVAAALGGRRSSAGHGRS